MGGDIVVLALAGGGSIAKSSRTKARLAAWSAGVLGAKTAVDKEGYFNKTLPAIISQMEASRRTVYAVLAQGLSRPDAEYGLLQAKADLEDYYIAGTLPGALSAITKEAGKQSDVADQKIAAIAEYKYTFGKTSESLLTYFQPADGKVDKVHEAAMLAWLKANTNVATVPECLMGACSESQKAALAKELDVEVK